MSSDLVFNFFFFFKYATNSGTVGDSTHHQKSRLQPAIKPTEKEEEEEEKEAVGGACEHK